MTSLCVIPARGGSQRIPRKNIRPFAGVPILARTIGIVIESGIADRVIVSTDDDEIAEVARSAGADVPFLRSADLAGDDVPTIPVVADVLTRLGDEQGDIDTVWVVYPTAVLLEPGDLVRAADEFRTARVTVAMSVVESPGPIERAWRRSGNGGGRMLSPEHVETRTQDLEPAFFDAGQFYVARADFWVSGATLADVDPLLVQLPRERAIDVDTIDDWQFAESVFAGRVATAETDRLEALWSGEFGDRYVERNVDAGDPRGPFWSHIIDITAPGSVLEVGCGSGNNLRWLDDGQRRIVGVDINRTALDELAARVPRAASHLASAGRLPFTDEQFDLVLSAGVLIHQPDESLGDVMAEMSRCSGRWILMAEYFAPSREEISYRGVDGALFRRDYGAMFADGHDGFVLRESGFIGRDEGWDDVTWWLFERSRNQHQD
jgi:pseudaminic acid cytidylyltransferase